MVGTNTCNYNPPIRGWSDEREGAGAMGERGLERWERGGWRDGRERLEGWERGGWSDGREGAGAMGERDWRDGREGAGGMGERDGRDGREGAGDPLCSYKLGPGSSFVIHTSYSFLTIHLFLRCRKEHKQKTLLERREMAP